MSDYKIVKLYRTNYYNIVEKSYGHIDLRKLDTELEDEINAANESLSSFGFDKDDKYVCLVTIANNDKGINGALNFAKLLFEETHDLLLQFPLADFQECGNAGYYINLSSNQISPILKKEEIEGFTPNMFQVNNGPYEHISPQQYIAAGRNDEIVKAYFRSINWFNKSKKENTNYLRFLYKWISFETLVNLKDNETIVPKLSLILGFPLKNDSRKISNELIQELNKVKNYRSWKNYIFNHLEECRKLRNDIVHSGFKEKDIDDDDLEKKQFICDVIHQKLIGYMNSIILQNITSIDDAWDLMIYEIELNDNLINDLTGNIIYRLENEIAV